MSGFPSGPYSGYSIFQLPVEPNPATNDVVPLGHEADGNTYQCTLAAIGALIGGGGAPFVPALTSDFTALTIYNYCATPYGAQPSGSAATNDTAMTTMFNAMSSAVPKGGLAFIPQYSFAINASNFTVPIGMNMVASGPGGQGSSATSFYHFNVTGDGTLFNCSGGHTSGGMRFQNLGIIFNSATLSTTTAIYGGTWNAQAINCTFENVPVAFSANGLTSGLSRCTINYLSGINGSGPSGWAAVVLNAPQCFFVGPSEIQQLPESHGGVTNCCAISIQGGAQHAQIVDLHISNWRYGITYNIQAGSLNNHITNCEFACYATCIYMQPGSSAGTISGDKYTSCQFYMGSDSTSATDMVFVDTNGGANSNVSDIEFLNCTVYQGGRHGYNIKQGENIRILGGCSSGNGINATGAGVAITGTCGTVTIQGVNLNAKYPGSPTHGSQAQNYALLVSGSPTTNVIVDSCDMASGYSGSPVSVTGTPTALYITNCHGYNDQATAISTVAPTASGAGSNASTAASLGSGAINYWGPSTVTFVNNNASATLHLNGANHTIPANAFGAFYLADAYATFYFSAGTLATFTWVGR